MRAAVAVVHGTARVERAAVAAQVLVEMLHQKQLVGQAQPILGLVVVDQQPQAVLEVLVQADQALLLSKSLTQNLQHLLLV